MGPLPHNDVTGRCAVSSHLLLKPHLVGRAHSSSLELESPNLKDEWESGGEVGRSAESGRGRE